MPIPQTPNSDEYLILIDGLIVKFALLCPKNNWAVLCPLISKDLVYKIMGQGVINDFESKFTPSLAHGTDNFMPTLFLVYQKIKSLNVNSAQKPLQLEFLDLCEKAINLLNIDESLQDKNTPVFCPPTDNYEIRYGDPIDYIKTMSSQYLEILPLLLFYNNLIIKMQEILNLLDIDINSSPIIDNAYQPKDINQIDIDKFKEYYPLHVCLGLEQLKLRTAFLDVSDDTYFLKHLVSPHRAQLNHAQNEILNLVNKPWQIIIGVSPSHGSEGPDFSAVYFICPSNDKNEPFISTGSIDKAIRFYNKTDLNYFIEKTFSLNSYALEHYAVLEFSNSSFISATSLAAPSKTIPPTLLDFINTLNSHAIKDKLSEEISVKDINPNTLNVNSKFKL